MPKPLNGKRKRGHVQRRQKAAAPQLIEEVKPLLLLRGVKPGKYGNEFLQNLKKLKPNSSVLLSRKNEVFPFDDPSFVERLCDSHNCGMFCLVSHSKKRPNNVILGRLFNGQLLDMFEFGINGFLTLKQVLKVNKLAKASGSDSIVLFQGDEWESSDTNRSLRLFLLDIFKPRHLKEVSLTNLDHVISLSLNDGILRFRSYFIGLKKNTAKKTVKQMMDASCPQTVLKEMGPRIDFKMGRTKAAPTELMALAMKTTLVARKRSNKNESTDKLNNKVGRIHMNTEDKQYFHSKKQKRKLEIS